ncbi:P-selectin-like [Coturnix japonica]|uniref:P-selectin-like n=1 Tax=Coturnix japonica TaxID=93934 RepID=UPI0007771B7F|nr:P-selectin-like [Coturnix japonica]
MGLIVVVLLLVAVTPGWGLRVNVTEVRTCPRLHLSLENGRVVPMGMDHIKEGSRVPVEGSWAEFSCDPGFRLVGSDRSDCTRSGTWSHPKPVCESEEGIWGG